MKKDRNSAIVAAWKSGTTLVEIGKMHSITRERVRQILQRCGLNKDNGGVHLNAVARQSILSKRRDERCLRLFGCTFDQHRMLRMIGKKYFPDHPYRRPTKAFLTQRNAAKERGIEWKFTLWEWWCVWQESGKWGERGRGYGYVMARRGDVGPYSKENVYITTSAGNVEDYHRFMKDRGEPYKEGWKKEKSVCCDIRNDAR